MSEENVEVIRRAIDAWNRGDLDGFLAGAHPDFEWHPVLAAGVEGSGGAYRGHDGARQFWAEFWDMFDEFRITIQSARAVGTSVLVLAQIQAERTAGSPWIRRGERYLRCAMACASRTRNSSITSRPSKPPVCGSSC